MDGGPERTRRAPALLAATLAALLVAAVLVVGAGATREGGDAGPERAGEVRPAPSDGCGRSRVEAGAAVAWARSRGIGRQYIREVPSAHDGRHPVPVVVDLHGWGGPALAHADYTQLGRLGEAEGFVTLTPQGAGQPPAWDAGADSPDVAFLHDLLDEAERTLCLDTRRVYVVGASNGAMLASTMACVGGGRIAAVAAVAGVSAVLPPEAAGDAGDAGKAGGAGEAGGECPSRRRPVPILAVHGTDDQVIRFEGGFAPGVDALPGPDGTPLGERQHASDLSVPDVMGVWAGRYGCGDEPRGAEPVVEDVRRVAYRCPDGAAVELLVVEGGGHGWPGANADPGWAPLAAAGEGLARTSDVSADKLIWAFFAAHPGGPAGPIVSAR